MTVSLTGTETGTGGAGSDTPLIHFYGVCERTHPDAMWAEPLNAFSSFGFFITVALLIRYIHANADLKGYWKWDVFALTGLIGCIGVGSFVFHTMPSKYTEMADVMFIVAFIVLYFISAVIRITRCNWFETLIGFIAFAGFTHMLVSVFPHALNDSIGYLSSMTALTMIAVYLNMKRRASARAFLLAAVVGLVSLFFRSIDNAVCEEIPIGTHFLWHSLNAVLVYLLMVQLIRNINRRARMLRKANLHHS